MHALLELAQAAPVETGTALLAGGGALATIAFWMRFESRISKLEAWLEDLPCRNGRKGRGDNCNE